MKVFLLGFSICALAACATTHPDKQRAELHLQIGTGYLTNGQYPQAMSELLKAQELDPTNPLILNNLGLAYYVRGKWKTAEEKFRAAVRQDSKFSEAKNNLGRVLIDEGRPAEALKFLHEVESDLTYRYQEKTLSTLGMAYF